jgi:superfamily II DNA or RNA helicase
MWKMSLRDHKWENRYRSLHQDLLSEFYVPALKNSKRYYRIAGYFSSDAIAAVAVGLSHFVYNGEKMYMIIGDVMSHEDVLAMDRESSDEEIFKKKWEDCLVKINSDTFIKDRFETIAWLIAHDKLEIKIGVNIDEHGRIIPQSNFHEKVVIFEDEYGDSIQTDGSANETLSAYQSNRESFAVHRSWMDGQEGYVADAKESFWTLWNGADEKSRVYDIPKAMREGLISLSPRDPPPLEYGKRPEMTSEKGIKLRRYQQEAIDAWKDAGKIGILEMATGTGKTITAINAVSGDFAPGRPLLIIVPQAELAKQWEDVCRNTFGEDIHILGCHSGNPEWRSRFALHLSRSKNNRCVIVTIDKTFRSNDFQKGIRNRLGNLILICDEVHGMGSAKNRDTFPDLKMIPIRLGLSATPKRHWDEEGNLDLSDAFGGDPVYTYGLKNAIYPDEGYDTCLCEYDYYFHMCSLNDEEREMYETLTLKIAKTVVKIKEEDRKDNKELSRLLNRRAAIIKGCENRLDKLAEILASGRINSKKCIIYCNNIVEVDSISKKLQKMGQVPLAYHSKVQNREIVLEKFLNEDIRFLVSVGCLDQGVDIPSCDGAIIMTSSQNPRQYVQRRGRVLRLNENDPKKRAEIHDMIVLPYELDDIERKKISLDIHDQNMIQKQLDRVDEFAQCATNRADIILSKTRLTMAIR